MPVDRSLETAPPVNTGANSGEVNDSAIISSEWIDWCLLYGSSNGGFPRCAAGVFNVALT